MAIERMLPAWARWKRGEPWTVGLEEEVMLLEPDGSPAWRSEDVLARLGPELGEHARGSPVRGKAWKTGVRAEARPESCPRVKGELAASASSTGTCARMPSKARTASSASGTATCTCSAKVGSRRASSRMVECRYW